MNLNAAEQTGCCVAFDALGFSLHAAQLSGRIFAFEDPVRETASWPNLHWIRDGFDSVEAIAGTYFESESLHGFRCGTFSRKRFDR